MPSGLALNEPDVMKAVNGLFVLTDKKLDLVDVPEKINLVVTLKKIPKTDKATTIELKLPRSSSYGNQSVCLFVKDLDKDDREFEKTKYHYQDLLKSAGLKEIPDIIPIKELLLEYKAFEAKRNLSNMYDVFLTDSRVAKVLPRILGKHFYGRKRIPKRVLMDAKPLKKEILNAIKRVNYVMSMKGSSSMVTIAHRKMSARDVFVNVMAAVKQISEEIPGGLHNIRNLYIRTQESSAVPLYISLDSPNDIVVPDSVQEEPEPQEPEEITTLPEGQKVQVTDAGDILLYSNDGKLLSVAEQNELLFGNNDMEKSERRASKRKASHLEKLKAELMPVVKKPKKVKPRKFVNKNDKASVIKNKEASVTKTKKASVIKNKEASVTKTKKASVTKTKKDSVTKNKKASVTKNKKASVPSARKAPRKLKAK